MKALGLDIGTTTISAAVLDREDGAVCDAKTIANQCFIDRGNEWERIQDVDRIMEKALAVANEMVDTYEDIETIGLTGQMHGILYFDEDGNSVSPLYTWQDGRGQDGADLEFTDIGAFEGCWRSDDGKTFAAIIWNDSELGDEYGYDVYLYDEGEMSYAEYSAHGLYDPQTGKLTAAGSVTISRLNAET